MAIVTGSPRSTTWQFTINNPTPEDTRKLMDRTDVKMNFCHMTKEKGQLGTPHWQGVVQFRERVRRIRPSKLMPRANLQPCDSIIEAVTYNLKWENFPGVEILRRGFPNATTEDMKIMKNMYGKSRSHEMFTHVFAPMTHPYVTWDINTFICHWSLTRHAPYNQGRKAPVPMEMFNEIPSAKYGKKEVNNEYLPRLIEEKEAIVQQYLTLPEVLGCIPQDPIPEPESEEEIIELHP